MSDSDRIPNADDHADNPLPDFTDEFFEANVENSILQQFPGCLTPVANQGNVDSCWAFPITDCIAAFSYIEQDEHEDKLLVPLSRQQLLDKVPEMSRKRKWEMHGESYANSLENAFEYIQKNGVYPRNAYPSYGYYRDRDREALDPDCRKYTVSGYRMMSRDEAHWMVKDRPVVANLRYATVFQLWKHFTEYGRGTAWQGGTELMVVPGFKQAKRYKNTYHAVLLVASGTVSVGRSYQGQKFFIAKNSFGPGYGFQGFCRVLASLLSDFCIPEDVKLMGDTVGNDDAAENDDVAGEDGGVNDPVSRLEGFVSNAEQSCEDPIEELPHTVFVAENEKSTVAELAAMLQADLSQLQAAASFVCRLGWAETLQADLFQMPPPSVLLGPKGPIHFGPPCYSSMTCWMKLVLYSAVASGPLSVILMKGQCLNLLLRHSAVLVQPFSSDDLDKDGKTVTLDMLLPLENSDGSPACIGEELGLCPEECSELNVMLNYLAKKIDLLTIGYIRLPRLYKEQEPESSFSDEKYEWVPLSVEFGIPLFSPKLCNNICKRVVSSQLLQTDRLTEHHDAMQDRRKRLRDICAEYQATCPTAKLLYQKEQPKGSSRPLMNYASGRWNALVYPPPISGALSEHQRLKLTN